MTMMMWMTTTDHLVEAKQTLVFAKVRIESLVEPVVFVQTDSKNSTDTNQVPYVEANENRKFKQVCKIENSGNCDNKMCDYFHPRNTRRQFSHFGYCRKINVCNSRHPSKVCREWLHNGQCIKGKSCRHRHPRESIRQYFLWF